MSKKMEFVETVEVTEFVPPLPAESAPPGVCDGNRVTYTEHALVDENSAPAPAMSYAGLTLVVEYMAPTPAVTYAAAALVNEYSAPALVESCSAAASVVDCIAPAPALT